MLQAAPVVPFNDSNVQISLAFHKRFGFCIFR